MVKQTKDFESVIAIIFSIVLKLGRATIMGYRVTGLKRIKITKGFSVRFNSFDAISFSVSVCDC